MISFSQKNYGVPINKDQLIKFIKTPAGLVSTSALGISAINMSSNIFRHHTDLKYQKKQLGAMGRLTNSLNTVDNSLKNVQKNTAPSNIENIVQDLSPIKVRVNRNNRRRLYKRERRSFSSKGNDLISNTFTGGGLGAAVGATLSKFLPNKFNSACAIGAGTLVGAALGLVYTVVKDISTEYNRASTTDDRLMRNLITSLKNRGLVEGKDFTRDPKRATELRTKASIVISRESGDLKLIINSVSDNRLYRVLNDIVNTVKSKSRGCIKSTENLSDRYNDIVVTTIENPTNIKLITEIVEGLVKEGYPVYILEVG